MGGRFVFIPADMFNTHRIKAILNVETNIHLPRTLNQSQEEVEINLSHISIFFFEVIIKTIIKTQLNKTTGRKKVKNMIVWE